MYLNWDDKCSFKKKGIPYPKDGYGIPWVGMQVRYIGTLVSARDQEVDTKLREARHFEIYRPGLETPSIVQSWLFLFINFGDGIS